MDNFFNKIEVFLKDVDSKINSNLIGINYLETIKSELIDNLKGLEKKFIENLKSIVVKEKKILKDILINNRKIRYEIEYIDKTESAIKHKTNNDYLLIILEGLQITTIYDQSNEAKSLFSNLSKNMGIVLPLNTNISKKIVEKTIILSI